MTATGRAYGGVSAAERQAQRRAALLEAGLDILGSQGQRLTVGALCARAGLNERYFYESFATCEDVCVAVYDDVIAELMTAIVTAVAAAPDETRAKARAAIAAAVELLTDDPRKSRVVFVEAPATPVLNSRRASVARAFTALLIGQAQEFYGPETALPTGGWGEFGAVYLLGGLAESMTAWLRGDLAMSRDELIEHSTDLFVLVGEHVIRQG
jgi:AcrR family transcriptional regulator